MHKPIWAYTLTHVNECVWLLPKALLYCMILLRKSDYKNLLHCLMFLIQGRGPTVMSY